MSKLESAFSKALEERSKQTAIQKEESPISEVQVVKEKQHSGNREVLLTTSRKQIAKMMQGDMLSEEQLAKKRLIHPGMEDTKLLSTYRNIRTKLVALAGRENFTTLVTSVVSKGSSSLIAANIAAVFAFDDGKTALLIDANIHAPALDTLFDLGVEGEGLIDYLESESISLEQIIKVTGIPRLRVIPTGSVRENSTEYLGSEKMGEFLSEILRRYPDRYPIFDAPSVLDSADSRILIDMCDQVILVIPYGQCTEAEIRSALDVIGKNKLAGVILDQF